MSITLLNVSWKAEELLNIALLLVQNLFYLPSLSLKIGLGLGFVFPLFLISHLYPVPGICHGRCWWRIFCVSIWFLALLFAVAPWGAHLHSPSLPSPTLVGEGCLCSTKSVLVLGSSMRNRVCVFPRKLIYRDVNPFTLPRALGVAESGTEKLQLWSC